MSAFIGKVWGWVRPTFSYRPWGKHESQNTMIDTVTHDKSRIWGLSGLSSWAWRRYPDDQMCQHEEFWEAHEKPQSMDIEDLGAGKQEKAENAPRWWNKFTPSSFWPMKMESSGLRRQKGENWNQEARDTTDNDADFSDYGTPPPSPTPPASTRLWSAFGLFTHSWKGDVLPEHYEICFNFLRHLFDLVVVGFLWTVSPPTKLVLEVLGVQGALRLWLHGMAMFFVSTVGMAGLLWLIQEYLPQFALIYGIAQTLVISVSVKQSVIFGGPVEEEEEEEEGKKEVVKENVIDDHHHKEKHSSARDKARP